MQMFPLKKIKLIPKGVDNFSQHDYPRGTVFFMFSEQNKL
jgi:hypothetical protein